MDKVELFRILSVYASRGWKLFPCDDDKKPLITNNLEMASSNVDLLMSWAVKYPACNWGLSLQKSGLFAIDVDIRNEGMTKWLRILADNNDGADLETLTQVTTTGGLHYLFSAEEKSKLKGKIQKGIDIKHAGYILVYPSTINGKGYKWKNWGQYKNEIPQAPELVKTLCFRDYELRKIDDTVNANDLEHFEDWSEEYLAKLAMLVQKIPLDYNDWVMVGMALHNATGGSAEGLKIFTLASQGVSYQQNDEVLCEAKWSSFSDREQENTVTILSLQKFIRDAGFELPNLTLKEDIEAFKKQKLDAIESIKNDLEPFNDVFAIDGENLVSWDEAKVVTWFNRQGFCFLSSQMQAPYAILKTDKNGDINLTCTNRRGIQEITAPYKYAYTKIMTKDVKTVYEYASNIWADSWRRKTFTRVTFKPPGKELPGELNLWSEINFPQKRVDCSLIKDFIFRSLCNENDIKYTWLIQWLAHLVQKPHERCSVVPVLISKQGAGKGLLFDNIMGKILGKKFTAVNTADELLARFNENLSRKFLTFIDEATWRGNKTEDGLLKRLIGSPTMSIEEKFGARYDIENYSRYAIASNNEEAVAIEAGNRRYVVIEASPALANDLDYFGPIAEAVEKTDIVSGFFYFLMRVDLKDFNPFQVLRGNFDGALSKINTQGAVAQYWQDVLFGNPRKIFKMGYLYNSLTYDDFKSFVQRNGSWERNVNSQAFWARTSKLVPSLRKGRTEKARFHACDPFSFALTFCRSLEIEFPEDFDVEQIVDLDYEEGG